METTPAAALLNADHTPPEVIRQAAALVAWGSEGQFMGQQWAKWRREILGAGHADDPLRELVLLQGQQAREMPPPLAAQEAQELACAWASLYFLRVRRHEKQAPRWLNEWNETRLSALDDWSAADARATAAYDAQQVQARQANLPIPRTLGLLLFDHALRWLSILVFDGIKSGKIDAARHMFKMNMTIQNDTITDKKEIAAIFFLVTINLVVIPVITFAVASRWNRSMREYFRKLCDDSGVAASRLRERTRPAHLSIIVVLVVVLALAGWYRESAGFLTFFALALYGPFLFFILRNYSVGYMRRSQFRQLLARHQPPKSSWTADENDEAILSLDARLKAVNRRMESYVLESALFGALALSGFLQIIAEELISFNDVAQFTRQVSLAASSLFRFDGGAAFDRLALLFSDMKSLFCLLCYESLFCAVAFLVVIAARLRFADQTDEIQQKLEVAHAFNDKEEQLTPGVIQDRGGEERRQWLNAKIREQLSTAQADFARAEGPMEFTRFFRNMGVSAYFTMLVTAGFFLTPSVAVFFAALWALSQAFFAFRESQHGIHDFIQWVQHKHFQLRTRINWAAAAIVALGHALSAFLGYDSDGEALVLLGTLVFLVGSIVRYLIWPTPLGVFSDGSPVRATVTRRLTLFLSEALLISVVATTDVWEHEDMTPFLLGFLLFAYRYAFFPVPAMSFQQKRRLLIINWDRVRLGFYHFGFAVFIGLLSVAVFSHGLPSKGLFVLLLALAGCGLPVFLSYRKPRFLARLASDRMFQELRWLGFALLAALALNAARSVVNPHPVKPSASENAVPAQDSTN